VAEGVLEMVADGVPGGQGAGWGGVGGQVVGWGLVGNSQKASV
jgi:hypothetical protein